jgi:hypothetical protein
MRLLLLPILLVIAFSANSQVTGRYMGEIESQFSKTLRYMSGIIKEPSDKDTTYLVQETNQFNAMMLSLYADADVDQKKALFYYTTVLQIRMGYLYAEAHYWAAAYNRFYKHAENGMKYVAAPGYFPVKFQTDSLEYTIERDYISRVEFIFYTDLLNAALKSKNWEGASEAYSTIIRGYKMPAQTKYVSSLAMILYVARQKNVEDMSFEEKDELVKYYAENISNLGQLNAQEKKKIFENDQVYDSVYKGTYDDIMNLLPQTKPEWVSYRYEDVGIAYYHCQDTAKARYFFMAALNSHKRMESVTLGIASDIAIATKDKEMGLKVIENLKEYHSWNWYEVDKIGSIYNNLMDDKKMAKKYFREAEKVRKKNH